MSATVDDQILEEARRLRPGVPVSAILAEALRLDVRARREEEIDAAYERAHTEHPIDERDEWGDLTSWSKSADVPKNR